MFNKLKQINVLSVFRDLNFSKRLAVVFIVIFAVGGVALLVTGKAATSVTSINPDKGTVTSPAAVLNDTSASDGHAVLFGTATPPPTALKNPGVFLIWPVNKPVVEGESGVNVVPSNSFLQGGQIVLEWSCIQPNHSTWNWTGSNGCVDLTSQLKAFHNAGKQATVQINSEHKPCWLYANGQNPRCTTPIADNMGMTYCGSFSSGQTANGQDIPKFWDPSTGQLTTTYATLEQDLITHLADEINNSGYKDAVLGVRTAPNLIGVETYNPGNGFNWQNGCGADYTNKAALTSYAQVMEMYYPTLMNHGIRPIMRSRYYYEVLNGLDALNHTQTEAAAITRELGPDKGWTFSTNADPDTAVEDGNFAEQYVKNGTTIGYQESASSGAGANAPISWNYWRILMELGRGTSYIGVYGDVVENALSGSDKTAYINAYDFANSYAGRNNDASSSPGAWIAFRGPAKGALQGDYTWFANLLNPNDLPAYDSAAGKNMLGPVTSPYGRYARKTDLSKGHASFEIGLNNSFKSSLSGNVTVTVTYFDQGSGSWTLQYGTGSGASKTITKGNTNQWLQTSVTVPANSFTSGLSGSSDITLTASGSDTYFHMVSVTRT